MLYQVAEADRVIKADVELDIREAPIREFDFGIPADYSVVAVSGASVADYITATEVTDGRRNLKVMFAEDVTGRQLVVLHLEKSEAAAAAQWSLPRIEYPSAKTVQGNIGIIGAAGLRIAVEETELLVDKPLSYFPKPSAGLQHAFRIRQPLWSAAVRIEQLQRSVQSDVFHLYSLSQETVYGSALINFFVTGAPVAEWRITVPAGLGNVLVDGQDVRTWRREDDTLIVSLHQGVMGAYTLLVTFEEKPDETDGSFQAGRIAPLGVQGERGYIQVVSPMQVEMNAVSISDGMLQLDPLELPAEFRLLSTAPPLGTWQYTERPFELNLKVSWFQPGTTVTQVVEFSEAHSRVSQDGELVTDVLYFVKSRGRRSFKIKLPDDPVRLWEVSVNGQIVTARQADDATLIPLPGGTDPNIPIEVSVRLGKPTVDESAPELSLPVVYAPMLKTQWNVVGDETRVLVPNGGTVRPPVPVTRPSGFHWVADRGVGFLFVVGLFTGIGIWTRGKTGIRRFAGLLSLLIAISVSVVAAITAWSHSGSPAPLQLSLPVVAAGETIKLYVNNTPLWRVDVSWFGMLVLLGGVVAIGWSFTRDAASFRLLRRWGGVLLIALGILLQGGGAAWFFALLALAILALIFIRPALDALRDTGRWTRERVARFRATKQASQTRSDNDTSGAATATMFLLSVLLSSTWSPLPAGEPDSFQAADAITQQWQIAHKDSRLSASGSIALTGKPGDRFLLLRAPAVLTRFQGQGLRLTKRDVKGEGLTYIISIPITEDAAADEADAVDYSATFQYQLESLNPIKGVPLLTGTASVQRIELTYDEAGWDVSCPTAVRVEADDSDDATTKANLLLGPGKASVQLKPRARDVTAEETQFFVEGFQSLFAQSRCGGRTASPGNSHIARPGSWVERVGTRRADRQRSNRPRRFLAIRRR